MIALVRYEVDWPAVSFLNMTRRHTEEKPAPELMKAKIIEQFHSEHAGPRSRGAAPPCFTNLALQSGD